MEAINDTTKSIAKALALLHVVTVEDIEDRVNLDDAIALLEEALSKLTNT